MLFKSQSHKGFLPKPSVAVLPPELKYVLNNFFYQLEWLLDLGLYQRCKVYHSYVNLH